MEIDEVKNKFEVDNPLQVIDFLGMMGDSVDNILAYQVLVKTAKNSLKNMALSKIYMKILISKGS